MSLVDSLLGAIIRLDGDSLVLHTGEKPYVVTSSSAMNAFRGPLAWGQVELSTRTLTTDAVSGMLEQLFSPDQLRVLDNMGAVENELPATADRPPFTVVAARGGDDIWVEIRPVRPKTVEQPVPQPQAAAAPAPGQAQAPESPLPATPPQYPDAGHPPIEIVPEVQQEELNEAEMARLLEVSGLSATAPGVVIHGDDEEELVVEGFEEEGDEAGPAFEEVHLDSGVEAQAPAAGTPSPPGADEEYRLAAARAEVARLAQAAREEDERLQQLREEAARLEAERLAQAARIAAEREEAERADAERREAQRLEAERLAAQRAEEEASRAALREQEAAQLAANREEAARLAARQDEEAARLAAMREEQARLVATREEEEARLAAVRDEQDRVLASVREEEARLAARREADVARLAAMREEEARIVAAREQEEARLAAVREEQARVLAGAREEEEARLAAIREDEAARLAAMREDQARLIAAREEQAARLASLREEEANLAAAREAEFARLAAVREEEAARLAALREEEERLSWERERARLAAQRDEEVRLAAQREESAAFAAAREQEAARLAALHDEETACRALLENTRAEAERLTALYREEAARLAAEREEEARQIAALRDEMARLAASRVEQEAAFRLETSRVEAAREELARLESERREAEKQLEVTRDRGAAIAASPGPAAAAPAVIPPAEPGGPPPGFQPAAPPEDEAVAEADSRPAVIVPLVRTLRDQPLAVPSATAPDLDRLLRIAAARGASGLYLVSQSTPTLRVDGEMQQLADEELLAASDVEAFMLALAPEPKRDAVRSGETLEWFCDVAEVGRLRCLAFRDHRGPGVLLRMMPARAISADQLGLSKDIQALSAQPDGLVLVAGPRASGKSTLMAALVDLINRTRADHVITIERQLTFVHDGRRSFVSQREVRGDAQEILAAVRAALREDPDVLVIEELRSADLVSTVLEAAESGRLVVAGYRAQAAGQALERIIEHVPAERRSQALAALSSSLRAVVAQALLRKRGGGRVAARELLLNTPAAASVIAEGKLFQLPAALESGRKLGSIPLNDSLLALVRDDLVDAGEAWRRAYDREGLLTLLKRESIDTSFVERLA